MVLIYNRLIKVYKYYLLIFIIILLFNGLKVQSANPEWSSCLEGKSVSSVAVIGDYLWVCSLEYADNKVTHKLDRKGLKIVDSIPFDGEFLDVDSKGNLWMVERDGFAKYDGTILTKWGKSDYATIGFPNSTILYLKIDKNDNVWFSTVDRGVVKFDGTSCTIFGIQDSGFPEDLFGGAFIDYIECDANNKIWICFRDAGVANYDGSKWEILNDTNSGLPTKTIYSIKSDKIGNIWFGTSKGLVMYDNQNWKVYNKANSGIPTDTIRVLEVDDSNNVWFGKSGLGIVKYDGKDFTIYDTLNSGLTSQSIRNIHIDSDNNKWIGVGRDSYDFALNVFNENGLEVTSVNESNINEISVSPNPASDFITITLSANSNHTLKGMVENGLEKLKIFDMLGIEVGQSSLIDVNNRIDISNLLVGVYFIKIGENVEKFVKM